MYNKLSHIFWHWFEYYHLRNLKIKISFIWWKWEQEKNKKKLISKAFQTNFICGPYSLSICFSKWMNEWISTRHCDTAAIIIIIIEILSIAIIAALSKVKDLFLFILFPILFLLLWLLCELVFAVVFKIPMCPFKPITTLSSSSPSPQS